MPRGERNDVVTKVRFFRRDFSEKPANLQLSANDFCNYKLDFDSLSSHRKISYFLENVIHIWRNMKRISFKKKKLKTNANVEQAQVLIKTEDTESICELLATSHTVFVTFLRIRLCDCLEDDALWGRVIE